MKIKQINTLFYSSIVLLLAILVYLGVKSNETFYPDEQIQSITKQYVGYFEKNANMVENSLSHLQNSLDTTDLKAIKQADIISLLMEELDHSEKISAFLILEHNHKITMLEKDQNSYLYAIDSSVTVDNVTWHRIDKDQNEMNTWIRALGVQMNIINRGTEMFNDNYQFQIPIWTTANRLLENNRKSIAAHITWKSSVSEELVTCIAILDRFNDLGMLPGTSDLMYQSYLLNINNDVFPFLGKVTNDSIASQLDQMAMESWKGANRAIPTTINFSFQDSDWWGQSNYTDIRGVNAILLVMDKDTLRISILVRYQTELLIALAILILLILLFFFRRIRIKSSSIDQYIKSQNTDKHASELIKQGENNYLEFKSSFRYDYVQNKVNKDLEYVIAKSVAAFSNGRGGTLLIGLDDDGNVLGLENDILTLKRKIWISLRIT